MLFRIKQLKLHSDRLPQHLDQLQSNGQISWREIRLPLNNLMKCEKMI